jgi:DNA-binding winged helix-turn-helix (wHTH) protein|tara:strand:+ start:648 stop:833 length:186 start_codon:yes stop_codon:yes gene_type:complete
MSTDTNSMLSAIFDTTVNNIQQQQKQDSLNYSIFELRKALKEISDELDILVKRIETIKEVS